MLLEDLGSIPATSKCFSPLGRIVAIAKMALNSFSTENFKNESGHSSMDENSFESKINKFQRLFGSCLPSAALRRSSLTKPSPTLSHYVCMLSGCVSFLH